MDEFRRAELLGAPNRMIGSELFVLDETIPDHTHDFVELAVVVSGTGFHASAAGIRELEPGSVIIMRPGDWHAYRECRALRIHNLYLAPDLFHQELAWILDYPKLAFAVLRGVESIGTLEPESVARAAAWLEQVAEVKGDRVPALVGLSTCVLGELTDIDVPNYEPARSAMSLVMKRIMIAMLDDLSANWTVGELARISNISESHLHRQFRGQLGVSPIAWLTQARGEAAARLLTTTQLPVAEVGTRVGWPDPNYFSRRFRSIYGVTPSAFRARFTGRAVAA